MKNKFLLMAVILFAACSKTEVQNPVNSSNVSNIEVPDNIPQGQEIVTWENPKGTYPNEKKIEYINRRVSLNEIFDGIKYFSYLRDPKTAPINTVVQKNTFAPNFRVGYIKQDSTVKWKTTGGDVTKILIGSNQYGNIYRQKSARWQQDNKGEQSTASNNFVITPVSNNKKERTGSGDGSDVIDGEVSNWAFRIIAPLSLYNGFDYPETGQVRYNVDGEIFILDYGVYDGKSDNVCTWNGEVRYLPFDMPGEWAEE